MKAMKMLLALSAVMGLASAAQAANSGYTGSQTGPTAYASGYDNSSFFTAPSATPTTSRITSISFAFAPYNNGGTVKNYLCWAQYNSTTYTCALLTQQSGTVTAGGPVGGNAKLQWKLTHNITGGTFPATAGGSDQLTVYYSY